MKQIHLNKEEEELKIANKHEINIKMIEILAGDTRGTASDAKLIKQYKKELGNAFYVEVIYFLTHIFIKSPGEAKNTFNKIVKHKKHIESKLKRRISIQVAVLDFFRNQKEIMHDSTIIKEAQITSIAKSAVLDLGSKLFDKRILFHDLDIKIKQIRKDGGKLSILFIDLDKLKKINDKFGHIAGDKVVNKVVAVLLKHRKKSDIVYRFGGDEFVVLLPECSKKHAQLIASKLFKAVRKTSFKANNGMIDISVSIGVSFFNRSNVDDAKTLLEVADDALYKAKRSGKEKISIFDRNKKTILETEAQKIKEGIIDFRHRTKSIRYEITGTPISGGIAMGKAFLYKDILTREIEFRELKEEEVELEFKRICSALKEVKKDIIKTRDRVEHVLEKKYADIFDAQSVMLSDSQIIKNLEDEIRREKLNAEQIVKIVFKRLENRFKVSENEIIRDKSDDIADLARRLLLTLTGKDADILARLPKGSILVSERLLPSDTVRLNRDNVNAIITEQGSKNSHAALLARSMNVPYIAKTNKSMEDINNNAYIIADADKGRIIVNPDKKEIREYEESIKKKKQEEIDISKNIKDVALIKKDTGIKVLANASLKRNIKQAIDYNCDGIGLYRIEMIYMGRRIPPNSDELVQILNDSFAGIGKREITVRLLDVGGDKTLPYIDMEGNESLLGLRGIRVLLKNPKLLETQLKAFVTLSKKYNLKLLIPMVSIPKEIVQVKEMLKNCLKKHEDRKIQVGAMIETPASVIKIKEILALVDFVSIGSNDLIQYVMAAGRENVSVAEYFDAGAEIVLENIGKVISEAKKQNKECILCGELAADVNYTKKLLDLGLTNFSVSSVKIPQVKHKIAEILKLKTKIK
ncbi:MAG: phosphoenolpyruvate--protein phosphotransferase [Elusimicrobia bacterium]|nr:phosphoenolpyruvate--protein phosphotransferase [Candidatus Liberimonas magnetica]